MRSLRKVQNQRGFTLVELIAAITILSLVMVPLLSLITDGYQTYYAERDKAYAINNAQEALNGILDDLRKYENQYTTISVTSVKTLVINDTVNFPSNVIEYKYDSNAKAILRNGISIIDSSNGVVVNSFDFNQTTSSDMDAKLFELSIELERGKSGKVTSSATYRRKY